MKVKYRCQLMVRLKTNKYYQELLYYLSSYINFLNIRFFAIGSRLLAVFRPLTPDPDFI